MAHYKIFIIQISNAVHTQPFIVPSSLFCVAVKGIYVTFCTQPRKIYEPTVEQAVSFL